jgi:glutamine amidotransferase
MKAYSIGIIDYGMGNHASVLNTFRALGYKVIISDSPRDLNLTDVLVLPGVGAFPAAMDALRERGLIEYLQKIAQQGRPLVGICLGMQLLADASCEHWARFNTRGDTSIYRG